MQIVQTQTKIQLKNQLNKKTTLIFNLGALIVIFVFSIIEALVILCDTESIVLHF